MIAFRKRHPSLCRSRFWREDVHWYGIGREVDFGPESRTLAFCLSGASQGDDDLYVMINAGAEEREFILQDGSAPDWTRAVDTGLASPGDIAEPEEEERLGCASYRVRSHAVVVLLRRRR
jgi:glycogen operon protein